MPRPMRKPPETRQHRGGEPKEILPAHIEAPEPPGNLLKATVKRWDIFWASPVATLIQQTDLPALERLFVNYDELERTRRAMYKDPPPKPERGPNESHNEFQIRLSEWRVAAQSIGRLIKSDKGLKLNPLLVHMKQLERNIDALEDRFGLTLRARQELGLTRLKAKTLAEITGDNGHQDAIDGEAEEEPDPRASLRIAGRNS